MLELQADTSPPGRPVVDPKHTAKVNKDHRGLISTPWSVSGIHEEADGSEEARRSVLPSPRCLEEPPCWEPVEVRRTDGFSQAKAGRQSSLLSVLVSQAEMFLFPLFFCVLSSRALLDESVMTQDGEHLVPA